MGGLGEIYSHIGTTSFFWNQSFVFPKVAQRGYGVRMNLSLSIQYHMPLLIAKKERSTLIYGNCAYFRFTTTINIFRTARTIINCVKTITIFCVSASETELSGYYSVIAKHHPAICSIVSTFSDSYVPSDKAAIVDLPPSFNALYWPSNEELTYTELLEVCNQITCTISSAEVQLIENHTQTQSENTAWHSQPAGRIRWKQFAQQMLEIQHRVLLAKYATLICTDLRAKLLNGNVTMRMML